MADIALQQILHTAGKEPLSTTNGALHTQVKGTDGLALKTLKTDTDGKLIVSHDSGLATEATLAAINTALDTLNSNVSTEAKLEAVRILVEAISQKDFATETTLAQVLTKLSGDPATATKQDSVKAVLDAISTAVAARATEQTLGEIKTALGDLSTATNQEAVKLVLDTISNAVAAKATEQTLGEIKTALTDGTQQVQLTATDGAIDSLGARADVAQTDTTQAATAIALLKGLIELGKTVGTENTLQLIQTALGGLNEKDFATQATLAQVLTKLGDLSTALTDGTQQVQLTGTLTELFGASLSDRPPASSVSVGATFMVVGTDIVYQSNGTDWVVIS